MAKSYSPTSHGHNHFTEDDEDVKSFNGYEEYHKETDSYSKNESDLLYSRSFTFRQEIEELEWVVPHNMGKYGSVAVYNDLNEMVYPDIEIIDENSIKIIFGRPNSGIAIVHV